MKLAQAMSASPYSCPNAPWKAHILWLSSQLDPSLEHPRAAYSIIAQDLGREADQLFDIPPGNEAPVAVSPFGQVFRWRLDGEYVAVKVQREGLKDIVSLDLYVLRGLAFAAEVVVELAGRIRQGLGWMMKKCEGAGRPDYCRRLESWARAAWAETNYEREARDQDQFRNELVARTPGVDVPTVLWSATAGRVLTTRWVEGLRLVDAPPPGTNSLVAEGLVSAPSTLLPGSLLSLALRVTSAPPFSPQVSSSCSSFCSEET